MIARGLTLIELLVAMAVFAVIGVGAYTSLFAVLDAREATRRTSERLADVQYAVNTFVTDLRHFVDRPVRAVEIPERAPLYAPREEQQRLIEFTRGGWPNPARTRRSTLARVEWRLEGEGLERWTRARPGAPASVEPTRRRLLENVDGVSLRFLDEDGAWVERWPPLNTQKGEHPVPGAVEVRFDLADWGTIRRLVALPAGPPEALAAAREPREDG